MKMRPVPAAELLAHVRPGIVVNDGGFGPSIVVQVRSDGMIVLVNDGGHVWSNSLADLTGVPAAGSVFDRVADTIAAGFSAHEETRPFAKAA